MGIISIFNDSQNRRNGATKPMKLNDDKSESLNKNNSNSICSVESLDDDKEENNMEEMDKFSDSLSMAVESVEDSECSDHGSLDSINCTKAKKPQRATPKIRMFNGLGYGLEDPVFGQTFDWIDSEYVRLLQLSTYSTVMGPKVKFVWKNNAIYTQKANKMTEHLHDSEKEDDCKEQIKAELVYHELEAWI